MQALTKAGFKSSPRAGVGSPSTDGSLSQGPSTSDIMASKRALKEQKLRDVTFKLIVGGSVCPYMVSYNYKIWVNMYLPISMDGSIVNREYLLPKMLHDH